MFPLLVRSHRGSFIRAISLYTTCSFRVIRVALWLVSPAYNLQVLLLDYSADAGSDLRHSTHIKVWTSLFCFQFDISKQIQSPNHFSHQTQYVSRSPFPVRRPKGHGRPATPFNNHSSIGLCLIKLDRKRHSSNRHQCLSRSLSFRPLQDDQCQKHP